MKKVYISVFIIISMLTSCGKDEITSSDKMRQSNFTIRFSDGKSINFNATHYINVTYSVSTKTLYFLPNIGCPLSVRNCEQYNKYKNVVGISELSIKYIHCIN